MTVPTPLLTAQPYRPATWAPSAELSGRMFPRPNPAGNPVAAKAAEAMRPKGGPMSLNLSTYVTLFGYGYTNVYELAPLLDPAKTTLALVSTAK